MVDYIQRESLGLLAAYSTVIAHTAAIMSSTVAIQIEENLGVAYVYGIYGGAVLLIAVFMIFSLKDVKESLNTKIEESEKALLAEAEAEEVYPKETDRLSSRALT